MLSQPMAGKTDEEIIATREKPCKKNLNFFFIKPATT